MRKWFQQVVQRLKTQATKSLGKLGPVNLLI